MTSNDTFIHPTAVVHEDAYIGSDCYIGPFCVIGKDVYIGNRNRFVSHVSIGAEAQHRSLPPDHAGYVKIGNDNIFREFVTVHRSTVRGSQTDIGNMCLFMACSHTPHDAVIEDRVTLCNNVLLGGHTVVMQGATIGLGSIVHQYQVIGSYAMLGMGTIVTKTSVIAPVGVYVGNPAIIIKENKIGIERAGLTRDDIDKEDRRFRLLKPRPD